jgi:hypothetical protein
VRKGISGPEKHNEIEPVAISIFAGLGFAFDVKRFEPYCHIILQ